MKIKVKLMDEDAVLPEYKTEGAAGLDLAVNIDRPITLKPGEGALLPSGIAIHISDPKYAAIVIPRSGLGHSHGIVLGNLTGLIDSDYQGEIMISLWNRGKSPFVVKPGDRVAQMVFLPIATPTLYLVETFESTTKRAKNGFGSTGVSYKEPVEENEEK